MPRHWTRLSSFCFVLGVAALLLSCRRETPVAPAEPPEIVAEVGGVEISVEDFVTAAERRHAQGLVADDPDAFLQELVDREVLIQRARAEGLHQDPEIRRLYENLLVGRLRAEGLTPKLEAATVSDDEIRTYYEAHSDEFAIAPKVRLALLRRSLRPGKRDTVLADLEEARTQALDLGPETLGFGKLAIRHSEDQASRYKGGDTGWVNVERGHRRCPAEVLRAAVGLESKRDMTPVIVVGESAYLARLIDRRPGGTKPLEDVEAVIRRRLLQQKRDAIEQAFLEEQRKHVTIRVFRDGLTRAAEVLTSENGAKERSDAPPGLP